MTAFAEMNLSRWETYMMGLLNIRNKSFPFSFKVTHWSQGHRGLSLTVGGLLCHPGYRCYTHPDSSSQIVGRGTTCVLFQGSDSVLTFQLPLAYKKAKGQNVSGGKT